MQPHFGVVLDTPRQQDRAVLVSDVLSALMPAFVAIGANSPDPADPAVDSQRLAHWRKLPRSGPFLAGTYDNYCDHARSLELDGEIHRWTELWYLVRLNKASIEPRGIDMQPTWSRLMGMKALVYCVADTVWSEARWGRRIVLPAQEELEQLDLSRMSLARPHDVPFWDFHRGRWSTLANKLEWLLDYAQESADDSGQAQWYHCLRRWATGGENGAAINRRRYAATPTPGNAHISAASLFEQSVLGLQEAA
jgi:gamma-glutamyl:cysteine ligase YbdK (ATP-grasp superfamily)